MAETKDNGEEKDEGQPKRNAALLRLPFGLCKRYGIAIQDSWTPRDAWNALRGRRGIDPREAMDDYLDDRDADKPSTKPPKKDTPTPPMSPKEAHDEVFGGSRNRLNKTPLKRAREGFENGTPEMQATTARLFKNDHWTMVNTSKDGDCYAHGKRVNLWDGTVTPVREVQLSSSEEGGSTIYAVGSTFYHESWHAVSHNYGVTGEESEDWSLATKYKFDGKNTFEDALFKDTADRDAFVSRAAKEYREQLEQVVGKYSDIADEEKRLKTAMIRANWRQGVRAERKLEKEYLDEHPEFAKRYRGKRAQEGAVYQRWSDVSDVVSSLTDGVGLCGAHSKGYWREPGKRAEEAFAEIASAKAVDGGGRYELLKRYLPSTVAAFEQIYDALNSGKLKPKEV